MTATATQPPAAIAATSAFVAAMIALTAAIDLFREIEIKLGDGLFILG